MTATDALTRPYSGLPARPGLPNVPPPAPSSSNTDGSTDAVLTTFDDWITGIELLPDGKFIVIGWFRVANGVNQKFIVRLNSNGTQDTVGIAQKIEEGMKAESILDAIMNNVYNGTNPVKLAQWKTARHVRRANQPTPPPPTP